MAGRLDVGPLLRGLVKGLRRRSEGTEAEADEKGDWPTRIILVVLPLLAFFLMFHFRVRLEHADQLLAGAALLSGALLTAFSQIASWRERVMERDVKTNASRVRSLNEAAAHVLVTLLASLVVMVCVIVLVNLDFASIDFWMRGLIVGIGAVAAALVTYVGLTLVIVVNLLWDAFELEQHDKKKSQRGQL